MAVETQIDASLLLATEQYVRQLLTEQLPVGYQYHSLAHTEQVVSAAKEIGRHEKLSEHELALLTLASWVHDIGYIQRYVGHEDASIELATAFFRSQDVEDALIEQVNKLIHATRLEVEPDNLMEAVLKDADLYNLSTSNALENSRMIRNEWKIFCARDFTDEEWDRFNYRFFKDHTYLTTYGKDVLEPEKKLNTKQLKKLVKRWDTLRAQSLMVSPGSLSNGEAATVNGQQRMLLELKLEQQDNELDKLKRKLKKFKKDRSDKPERGIETMFRTTYRTHINLSDLADNKANILLSINAIIISIVLTEAFSNKLDFEPYMIYCGFGLMAVCMTTIVFAILATRPKVNEGVFDREDIIRKKTNLLFFGNFHNMDLEDFQWGINQMMNDAEYLYGSMSKDIYFLGKVLARKFSLLRIAYNVFMYGMGTVVLAIFVSYMIWGNSL